MHTPQWTLTAGPHTLHLNPATGLPTALGHSGHTVTLRTGVELLVGGAEARAPLGGLDYPGAGRIAAGRVVAPVKREGPQWMVRAEQAGWLIDWIYRPCLSDAEGQDGSDGSDGRSHPGRHRDPGDPGNQAGPAWAVSARLRPGPAAQPLRGLTVTTELDLPDAPGWCLDAPGNRLRTDLPLADLTGPIGLSTLTSLRGSPGLVCLSAPDASHALLWWASSTDELTQLRLAPPAGPEIGLAITLETGVAAAPDFDTDIRLDVARIGLHPGRWADHRSRVRDWYPRVGVERPDEHPQWTSSATLYEAQLGYSVFGSEGWTYQPYPSAEDLLADLPRIRGLGFDTIQLMPRQPYPSYNVHDYADIDTSYGPERTIAELVRAAHGRGMRVVLDVILHGVLDRESIDEAVAGVRAGPYADRVDEAIPEISGVDLLDTDPLAVAWSRHILDFAPHWRAGSPPRHPLYDAHPDWFCADSAGRPTGVYTKAFDLSHPEWRGWFLDAMVELVRRLDIDGFRFDAPTYNAFASWAPRVRRRASAPSTGAIGLFRAARERLRAVKPDLMLYTEPSGPALRQSMDLNYNYDEQWLIPAVMATDRTPEPWLLRDAADLAAWFADRDRTLPPGAVTAHHIDSHDTFWWPRPGAKWRREQYGLPATRALASVFALTGGAFMSFVGAETGIEDHLRRINHLRATHPAIHAGATDYDGVRVGDRGVFAAVRRPAAGAPALVLVNLTPRAVRSTATVRGWPAGPVTDLLSGSPAGHPTVSMAPYQTLVLTPAGP